jgi:acyl-CoA hydrolase
MHPFPSCYTVTLYGEGGGKSIAGTRMFAANKGRGDFAADLL